MTDDHVVVVRIYLPLIPPRSECACLQSKLKLTQNPLVCTENYSTLPSQIAPQTFNMCEYVLTTCSKIRPPKGMLVHRRMCGAVIEIQVELCNRNVPGEPPCRGRRETTRNGELARFCDSCKARTSIGSDSGYATGSSSSSGIPTSGGSAVSEISFFDSL